MQTKGSSDLRRRELARIHIAKHELGLDDESYRAMLWACARVRSARDLDAAGRARVLDHLKACGFKGKRGRPHPGSPHNLKSEERGPQLSKVEALLADAGRPWAYVDGMAQRMFGVARVTWCNQEQLQKTIAALVYDQRRRNSKSTNE